MAVRAKDAAGKAARAATDPNGPTGRLATWLAETTLDDVPAPVREHAKHLLLDGVACALVGAQLPVSRIGVEGITTLDNAGSALLIGWGGRTTSAPSAAMLNSSFIQGFELTLSRLCTATHWSCPRCLQPPRTSVEFPGLDSC
jgi:hypothetical protein